jgi:hypothetical protein
MKFLHPVLNYKGNKPFVTESLIINNHDLKSSGIYKSERKPLRTGKNKMERFYNKISLNTILYTSMIGIIGGVTAAQL